MSGRHRRFSARPKIGLILAMALIVGAIAAPASATQPDPDSDLVSGHKIWICHATRSLSNPYVKILIDIAAWDIEDPDSNDHGPEHHLREKNGVIWGDYALVDESEECSLDVPPPPPELEVCPTGGEGTPADYVVAFPGTKLVPHAPYQTVSADIDAGTYDVILISGDYARGHDHFGDPLYQPHEQWLLQGSVPSGNSGYSDDLPDTVANITGQVTMAGTVVFTSDVGSVTAEHWSVAAMDRDPNSVVPEYACLIKATPTGGQT